MGAALELFFVFLFFLYFFSFFFFLYVQTTSTSEIFGGTLVSQKFKILMCVEIWKKIFSDYKQKNDKRDFLACRSKFNYSFIFLSRIFSHVPLWSMILSRLSSSHLPEQLVVQKYCKTFHP